MFRIDSDGATVDHKFTDGNPQTGQEGTIATAEWLNAVQEGLCRVIEHAELTVNRANDDQLWQAIVTIATGVAGGGAGAGSVPTTRAVTGAGLASGGGALTGDLVLTVARALAADILAGTEDGKAITPAQLRAAAQATLEENGSDTLPSGRIEKWGSVYGTYAQGAVYVAFPVAFPTACLNVQVTPINLSGSGSASRDFIGQRVSRTKDGFTAYLQSTYATGSDASSQAIDGFEWRAIGK